MDRHRQRLMRGSGAIVLGSDLRALGIVRSLGRRGIPVVAFRSADASAVVSRYVIRVFPEVPDHRLVETLLELAGQGLEGWTLFPTTDETAVRVARQHELLARHFRLTTPPWSTFVLAHDKRRTYAVADQAGLAVPWTRWATASVGERKRIWPIVLKPAFKDQVNPFTMAKAWLAHNPHELAFRFAAAVRDVPADAVLLQEHLAGSGDHQFSYAALASSGEVVAGLAARRTRQYPRGFGHSSSFVETVDFPELERQGQRLLKAMNFTGLVEVEFKRDREDGRLKVLDVNPRVWTWHAIGGAAGVDFPYLAWLNANGQQVPSTAARPGVRWMRPATDLLSAAGDLREGRLTVRQWVRGLRRPLVVVPFAADDLRPALEDLRSTVTRVLRRRRLGDQHASSAPGEGSSSGSDITSPTSVASVPELDGALG